ncbi:MAG: HAMP domain-containing sensor histidine kinase [Candidatus Sericytochromatia bacterium]
MGQFLSRRALAPMVQMTREVQNMAGHTLDERVDLRVQSPDEIRQLGETFNGLLDRIQEAFVRQEQFVSDASHELRSPLTVIRGHAQLVLKRGQAHPEVFREGLENLIQETGRLERMVTDMLFLARSQATPEPHQPLDMVALIQRTVQELQPLHPQLQLELPAEAIWIEGNADRLKQVLINLLDNALRAIDPQGQVWISCHENGSQVEVEVRDNGVGIEPDHLPHLFDRFYRVDTARSRGRGGSGLGLAISHQIIEDHGGKISVASQRQQGSRFVFWLPLLLETRHQVGGGHSVSEASLG